MKTKRVIAMLLAMAMLMTTTLQGTVVNAQEAEETYSISNSAILSSNDNYEISETINSKWDEGYVATIRLKNTGLVPMKNWSMYFDLEDDIANIWGAQILDSDGIGYEVKCYDWNSVIEPNETIEFGFIVNSKDTNGIECLIVFDESDLSSIDEIEMPDVNETNKEAVEQLPPVQESDYSTPIQTINAATKIIKDAIKFIKKNKKAAAEVIERISGKTVAKNFLKNYDKVVKALDPLLSWTDIPVQAVYDAVRRVLVNAGVKEKVAVNIALAIKEGLSWFF